jgi:hypothetical protein
MARTKQEIKSFLNSQVGKSVNAKCGRLQGQCVSLIKALFEFLGVDDPYVSRGNAKDAGNNYVAQNIAEQGKGWLTVCINPNMGGGYGHIWIDIKDSANYEQNGARALITTKNTRPISQGRQFVNLDKHIKPPGPKITRKLTWTRKRMYKLLEDTYIVSIPDNKKAGTILHKKGETFDIGEYTEWSNGKRFYRTKKQVADKDMRGYGKSKMRRIV